MIFVIYWIVQTAFSFWALQRNWRKKWDLEVIDAFFFGLVSVIPVAWVVAIVICLIESSDPRVNKTVLKKYEK